MAVPHSMALDGCVGRTWEWMNSSLDYRCCEKDSQCHLAHRAIEGFGKLLSDFLQFAFNYLFVLISE